jgi:hypothetical protein
MGTRWHCRVTPSNTSRFSRHQQDPRLGTANTSTDSIGDIAPSNDLVGLDLARLAIDGVLACAAQTQTLPFTIIDGQAE